MNHNLLWQAVAFTVSHEEIHVFGEAPDSVIAQKRCYERPAEEWNVARGFIDIYSLRNETELREIATGSQEPAFVTDNRFVGLPLLIFSIVFIPPIFIGIHYPILILMNVVLLTERSDRDVWRHRSENDLSVIGIIRPAVVSSTPFYFVFSDLYYSGVTCSVGNSGNSLKTGGEV
ncbi:hypothetical protein BWH33_17940 [Salmonella enterica subsp. enterica serovar Thompson]|nr:hypothetical protein [Salmonella enterica]ECT8452098.1 hypothetical protein [Salmonella enterica subsp. enterica serovar Thompson]ECW3056547.1 hypothetical protein [Salmonella enterica subsp. enterica serovar Thompson]EGQ6018394.1 hypothetical protein [Salmonella enterica subsp. enterica serovar Sandiego]